MSISGSLSNALSGLNAAARAAEVVSSNVSNALTDGYGRRELELSSRSLGGNGSGVAVRGVNRLIDERTVSERRLADSTLGQSSTAADFYGRLQKALGLPDDPASVSGQITTLETNLIEAASRPDSDTRLSAAFSAASALANRINQSSNSIQQLRLSADSEIAHDIEFLNDSLVKIETLNRNILTMQASGHETNGLADQRQQLIDGISSIVPLRQISRDNGQIALFTTGGAVLVDGKAAVIGFTPANTIVPQMTIGSSALSGITINGRTVVAPPAGPMAGGSLSGLFQVRDNYAVVAQERLDAVSRDLVSRFADPAVDPTLLATDPGIFTDAGAAFNAANEVGLSSRLSINALIDPNSGGALWKIRDGLGAVSPGDVGNASRLQALANALRTPISPVSGGFNGTARSAVGLAGDMLSLTNMDLRSSELDLSFASAQVGSLKSLELQSGVDTDHEMQQLLLIEQAYTANARVVTTIDDMINTMLRL